MTGTDAFGRPLSDDGRWFWDGIEWQPYSPPPPVPERVPMGRPPERAVPTEPVGPAGGGTPQASDADAVAPTPPGTVSPDGSWLWDGSTWQPVAAREPEPVTRPGTVSPDGTWVWDGTAWRGVASPPGAGAATAFDPRAEVKHYPTMWKMAGRALRDVPALLEPGEAVVATAPGEGQAPQFSTLAIATGLYIDQGYLLVASDRRLLALGLTLSAGAVANVHSFPYADVTHWRAELSRAATLVTRTGKISVASDTDGAGVKRIPGTLFEAVRAAVEGRLGPAVRAQ